jgi:rhodanese-related sulfurtransferase
VSDAAGIGAGKRDFSQKHEKQKLCHKRIVLTLGKKGLNGPRSCCTRRVIAPKLGGARGCCDAVVQHGGFDTWDFAFAAAVYTRAVFRRWGVPFRPKARVPMASDKASVEQILIAAQKRAEEAGLSYFGAVTPLEAQTLLSADPQARLIDVRTRAEWDYVGRAPNSSLVEWNTYPGGTRNPVFLDELQSVAGDREAPVLFLCRSGQRSDSAARVAAAAGYAKAFNVLEGFEGPRDPNGHRGTLAGWRKAGLPWVQS